MKISKLTKAFILGSCITVLSSTAAFAQISGEVSQGVSSSQQSGIESPLLKKQTEIDKFIFETNAKEIADKGFTVTNTAPVGNHVEIGITPFNEANAEYLYKAFGKAMVKVVEGQQATTMDITTTSASAGNGNSQVTASGNAGEEIYQTTSSDKAGDEIFQTTASGTAGEEIFQTTAVGETKETSKMLSPMVIALSCTAGVGIIGSAIIVLRRRKAANS